MIDKAEASIENLLANIDSKIEQSKVYEWGIKDFNNVETADRKLLINKKYEFWVHDDALCTYSEYFSEIFGKTITLNNTMNNINLNVSLANLNNYDDEYRKIEVILPHEHLFFDVLLWIYTKDTKKLKKAAKTFHPFLYLISLGIHLKMKSEFFEILLTDPKFEWKIEYFNDMIWSKTIFTFPILERIIEEMKTNNFTKIIALLSWLKEINQETNTISTSNEVSEEILTSHDLFLVRNYIKRHKLMSKLTAKEISLLSEKFPLLHSSFDSGRIIEEFVFCASKKLICIICKREFVSGFELVDNIECKGEFFHPKNAINIKNDKTLCLHDGCARKLNKLEYTCCHKPYNSQGCLISDGRHLIVFKDN